MTPPKIYIDPGKPIVDIQRNLGAFDRCTRRRFRSAMEAQEYARRRYPNKVHADIGSYWCKICGANHFMWIGWSEQRIKAYESDQARRAEERRECERLFGESSHAVMRKHFGFRNRHIWLVYEMGFITYQELGDMAGITRERVRQIVASYGRKHALSCRHAYGNWVIGYASRPLEFPEDAAYRDKWIEHDIITQGAPRQVDRV